MKIVFRFLATAVALILTGCSTTAHFKLPPNMDILIKGQRAQVRSGDESPLPKIKTRPFFWNSMSGINYKLVQGNKTIKEGKLPSGFRVASIFWPPYAIFYWPVGFGGNCFDLTKEYVERCALSSSETENRGGQAGNQLINKTLQEAE